MRARLALALMLAALPNLARAAWQPDRPIELIVPSGAGGEVDVATRTLQRAIADLKLTDQPSLVVNKPGGGNAVALSYLMRHKDDGDHVLIIGPPIITNQMTGANNVGIADVTPIAILLGQQVMFTAAAESPIRTGRDLVDRLKADPSSVTFASSNTPGGESHMAASLLMRAVTGDARQLKIVFFRSGGEAVTEVMGGHVTIAVSGAPDVVGGVEAGKLRVIGTPAPQRLGGVLADVPTWQQQGVDVLLSNWLSVLGPPGMSPEQIAWWEAVIKTAVHSPQWQAAAQRNFWTENYKPHEEAAAFLQAEQAHLADILTSIGLKK